MDIFIYKDNMKRESKIWFVLLFFAIGYVIYNGINQFTRLMNCDNNIINIVVNIIIDFLIVIFFLFMALLKYTYKLEVTNEKIISKNFIKKQEILIESIEKIYVHRTNYDRLIKIIITHRNNKTSIYCHYNAKIDSIIKEKFQFDLTKELNR